MAEAEEKKAAKDKAQQNDKKNVDAKCTARVDLGSVYLDVLSGNCYDYTKSADWQRATEECQAAKVKEDDAIKEQKKANTDVDDKKKSLQTAKTEATRQRDPRPLAAAHASVVPTWRKLKQRPQGKVTAVRVEKSSRNSLRTRAKRRGLELPEEAWNFQRVTMST